MSVQTSRFAMFGLKLNKYGNFRSLEVVGRGSEVSEHAHLIRAHNYI